MVGPKEFRQYCLTRREAPDPAGFALKLVSASRPTLGPAEILVRINAVALNRRDILIRDGQFPTLNGKEFVPLSDGAGEVVAIGSDVTRVKAGDRVASIFMPAWLDGKMPAGAAASVLGNGGRGVLSEYAVLDQDGVVTIGDTLSYQEAATLPSSGVTAWHALVEIGKVAAGEKILVQGTGGVSLFVLAIAVAMGANVTVISSSDDKLERCRALGAKNILNYRREPEWGQVLHAQTGGFDHIVDVGGASTINQSFAAIGVQGHIALVGGLGGFPQIQGLPIIVNALRVSGVAVGSRAHAEHLIDFVGRHNVRPVIDSTYRFDDAAQAYDRLYTSDLFGNVVIEMIPTES